VGATLAGLDAVHAMTDVTGFGLAGHLLEICRGSKLDARVRFADLPLIDEAVAHVKEGIATGASTRNWAGYGDQVELAPGMDANGWEQKLVTDPQTSGGLLVACAPDQAEAVLATFREAGFAEAAVIGELGAASDPAAPRLRLA
jgi:selenide,water dikinase